MLPNKSYLINAFYAWIVDSECTPYFVVDTLIDYVQVPEEFIQNNQIVLNVSPEAVREFVIEKQYIKFKARFSGEVQDIYVPLKAVVAVYAKENGRGMVFDPETGEDADHPLLDPQPSSHFLDEDSDEGEGDSGKKDSSHLKIIK